MSKYKDIKLCKYCNIEKTVNNFAIHRSMPDGRANKCKNCHKEYLKLYSESKSEEKRKEERRVKRINYELNKEEIRKRQRELTSKLVDGVNKRTKEYSLKRKFGISLEEYKVMLELQNGLCAICGNPETGVFKGKLKNLAVDHCHKTGKVRKLLCSTCNNGLGCFKDNEEIMKKAIMYIREFKEQEVECQQS